MRWLVSIAALLLVTLVIMSGVVTFTGGAAMGSNALTRIDGPRVA